MPLLFMRSSYQNQTYESWIVFPQFVGCSDLIREVFTTKSKSSYACSSVLSWASVCHSILCTLASRSKQTTNLVKKIHENLGFIVSELVAGSCEQDNHFSLTNMSVPSKISSFNQARIYILRIWTIPYGNLEMRKLFWIFRLIFFFIILVTKAHDK